MKALFLIVAFAGALPAQSLDVSRIALYGGLTADLITTQSALNAGYKEANPILGQNPYRRGGLAVAGSVAVDLAARWIKRDGHPKIAAVLKFIGGGAHVGAAVWNVRR